MAATPDRTTIKAAISELASKLRTNLVADPPTASKPFRGVEVADPSVSTDARPSLRLCLTRAEPIGTIDGDKVMSVSMKLRIVTDVTEADPHDAILDKIGALDDYLDSIADTGVMDGAEGFDDRAWTFDYPRAAAGTRLGAADATQTFVVKVERQQNRQPAT